MVAALSLGNKAETSLRADGVRVGAEPQRALLLLPAGKGEDCGFGNSESEASWSLAWWAGHHLPGETTL